MNSLPEDLWQDIQKSIPIPCVDIVLTRLGENGKPQQVGLIRRFDASGKRTTWCHIGGRVNFGESLREAILRHVSETVHLDVDNKVGNDPQPAYVQQYFTEAGSHPELPHSGVDTRKHAIALSYLIPVDEEVRVQRGSEGLEFSWFNVEELSALTDVWPGSMDMIRILIGN